MSVERLQVLKMLEQGKITYEEALALIQALNQSEGGSMEEPALEVGSSDDADSDGSDTVQRLRSSLSEMGAKLGTLGQQLGEATQGVAGEVAESLQGVAEELSDVGQEVGKAVDWQALGRFFGEREPQFCWQEEMKIDVPEQVKTIGLSVNTKNGYIRLLPSSGEQIVVKTDYRLRAASQEDATEMAAQGLEEQQQLLDDKLDLAWTVTEAVRGTVSFEILLPVGIAMEIDLNTKNGDIFIKDAIASGKIESKNGSLKVAGGRYNQLTATTKNGSIHTTASIIDYAASSKNGNIRAVLQPMGDGKISASNSNGSIFLELPAAGVGYQLDLLTKNGGLYLDLPELKLEADEKRRIVGVTRDWDAAAVKTQVAAVTKNGSITIR